MDNQIQIVVSEIEKTIGGDDDGVNTLTVQVIAGDMTIKVTDIFIDSRDEERIIEAYQTAYKYLNKGAENG